MNVTQPPRTAAPQPGRGLTPAWLDQASKPWDSHTPTRSGVLMQAAPILLLILLAAASLWFGPITAQACTALEDVPCGP